jgi:hypothetical protein
MAHISAISFWEGYKRFLVVDSIKKGQTRAFLRFIGALFTSGVNFHPFCAQLSENGAKSALFGKMASQTSIDLRRLFRLRYRQLEYVHMHDVEEFSSKGHDFERLCAFWHLLDPLEVPAEGPHEGEGQGGVRDCLLATVALVFSTRTVP